MSTCSSHILSSLLVDSSYAELELRNFVILLVSLPTQQPSDQLGARSQLFNFANTIVLCVAQSPFLLHTLKVHANKLQIGTAFL